MTTEAIVLVVVIAIIAVATALAVRPSSSGNAEPATADDHEPQPDTKRSGIEEQRQKLSGAADAVSELLRIRAIQYGLDEEKARRHSGVAGEVFADTMIQMRTQAETEGKEFHLETAASIFIEANDAILQNIAQHYAEQSADTSEPNSDVVSTQITQHETFKLAGTKAFQNALEDCSMMSDLMIEPADEGGEAYAVLNHNGDRIGTISAKHKVAKALEDGDVVLHASVNSIGYDNAGIIECRIRVVTGPEGANWSQPQPPGYTVPLVGEQHYQAALKSCRVGDSVDLLYEPDNPYDAEAVVAVSRTGDTLGYIPRDNWLHDALREGKGAIAKISSASAGHRGFTEVLLAVTLVHGSATIGSRAFRPARSP